MRVLLFICLLAVPSLISAGCRPAPLATLPEVVAEEPTQTSPAPAAAAASPNSEAAPTSSPAPLPALSAKPASTETPPPEPSPLPTAAPTTPPTATPIGPCSERIPADDLLTAVTLDFGISRDYEPDDLRPLADDFPMRVTKGYPSKIREVALGPLEAMIAAMEEEGLHPQVLSAYRSYAAQAIAWDKWNRLYPDHASIISAPPGFSEHQLGTVVDFGSPELAGVVGQEDIEFHTLFYKTSEGAWLIDNAHRFGFTLSFPADASDVTGFYYEPWHFRYVGEEMATMLYENEISLIEYQLERHGDPCVP